MSQEDIEKEFPELKNAISQAHVKPFGSLGMSETEWANHRYVTDRYFLMDSQKLLSWRDPNYTAKFNHYILEEGINPITLEPATAEEVQTAEWYNRIHPITETLSWGTALYSAYVGYNQYYNKPYTTIPEAFGKGKDWIKGKIPSMGSQPVVPDAEVNTRAFTEKTVPDFVTRNDNNFYDTRNYKGNPKAYINEDGYLVSVNPEGDLPIHSQIRGGNSDRTPYISTTDPEFSTTPKNYGSDRIRIDSKQIQHDIETGKLKNVEVITHQEIVDHLQKRVDQAQVRYNKNPNDINTRRLNDAKKDLFNTKRDGEVLIKGSIPPEYFTFE